MHITTIAEDLVFPECLRWSDGRLWFVDMYDGRLCSVEPRGEITTHLKRPTYLGGITWCDDGSILVVDKLARTVLRLADGQVGIFADLSEHCSSKLNDALTLPNGDLIIGEYGFDVVGGEAFKPGGLYRVSPEGAVDIAATGLAFPNGMAISPDGRMLYVAETVGQKLTRYMISETGDLTDKTTLARFERGNPDGMSIDQDGALWSALLGPRQLVKTSADGEVLQTIDLEVQPFDVAVADSPDTLYIGVSNAVASDLAQAELPRTGAILQVSL